jgi:type I pantothenate kinase
VSNTPNAVERQVAAAIERQRVVADGPVVVGVAGSVAVGKTTFATALSDLTAGATRSTDGFLLPNQVLIERGILDRKGFPESYDLEAIVSFIDGVRTGQPVVGLNRYSHETFDVETDPDAFGPTSTVILEGVNALQPEFADKFDITVYLDAEEDHIAAWYTDRFRRLTELARTSGEGFYTRFLSLNPGELTTVARSVWASINRPNLLNHILPTRDHADWVIHKAADHSMTVVRSPDW